MIVSICLTSFVMKHFRLIIFVIFFFPPWEGISQTEQDSVHYLAEVLIKSSRLQNFTSTHKFTSLDSMTIHGSGDNNLADLLSHHTPIFVKSYGLGSLSTTSFRGTGASHTAVLWNGFNLQNPANGQVDWALIPAFILDNVEVQHGGSSALFGSGAVGGAVHFQTALPLDKGYRAEGQFRLGSYGQLSQGYKLGYSNKNLSSSLKLYHLIADNDFTYRNYTKVGNPLEIQTNAKVGQYGFMQDNLLKINKIQQLNIKLWYQFSDREVPPTLVEQGSQASQEDQFWRFSAEWRRNKERWQLAIRSAYFDEQLIFMDPGISLISVTDTRSSITEIENEFKLGDNWIWNLGINESYFYGKADNFSETQHQNRFAGFTSLRWNTWRGRLVTILSLRQEVSSTETAPITPSLGIDVKLGPLLSIQGNIVRTYRLPTFNDLYWLESGARGNPDLESEKGWSEDLTIS